MAKGHVKECPPAKPELQTIKVKTMFLNLEKDKNKNKTDATTTKKDQKITSRHLRNLCRDPEDKTCSNREVGIKLFILVPEEF